MAGAVGKVLYCVHSVTLATSLVVECRGICSPFTDNCGMKTNTTALHINLLIRYSRFENSPSLVLPFSLYFSMSQPRVLLLILCAISCFA